MSVPDVPPPVPSVPSGPSEPPPELFEQIGRLCAAWAYVENQVERTIWGVLIIDELVGQHITYRLDMPGRWELLMSIARDHFSKLEREQLKGMSDKIPNLTADRNLYVHGIISARAPDWEITGTLYRGKDSGKPTPLTTAGVIGCRDGLQDHRLRVGGPAHEAIAVVMPNPVVKRAVEETQRQLRDAEETA